MRCYFALLVFISASTLLPVSLLGQSDQSPQQEPLEDIIDIVETMPILLVKADPQDGLTAKQRSDTAILQFIKRHFRYVRPDACVEGILVMRFTITEEGLIDQNSIECVRGIHPDFDKEGERVVCLMAELGWRWQPGTMMGKPVPISINLPIRVGLQ